MAFSTVIMIALICVGCALAAAGAAAFVYQAHRAAKAAKRMGLDSKEDLSKILDRVRTLEPRIQELQEKQKAVAETLEGVSATARELDSLRSEINRATHYLPRRKS